MKKASLSSLCVLMLVGACSSHPQHREDEQYALAMDTGHTIFERGYMSQAAIQYKKALQRAFASNDARGIHDAGYNLATSELRQNKLDECLATINTVSEALKVRGWSKQEDLHLVRSYALYGLKRWRDSEEEARQALLSQDVETHEQAYTVLGLNAAANQQQAALQEAIDHLQHYRDVAAQNNLLELRVHQRLMSGQWAEAVSLAAKLVKVREEGGDHRAMRRALFLQAHAYEKQGNIDQAEKIRQQIQDSIKNENIR